jgi:rod shape determining protein RodA
MNATTPLQEASPAGERQVSLGGTSSLVLPFDPLLVLHTATRDYVPGSPLYFVERQAVYLLVGVALMVAVARIDYSRLRELKHGLYALLIGSILAVFALGRSALGSQRAITLPFFSFQASEVGKLLLVLVLAAVVVDRARRVSERENTVRVMLLALIPAMLVIAQPDLGSGLVYIAIALAILYIGGTAWQHFAALFALGAVAIALVLVVAPAAGVTVLKQYQVDRLTAFLNPSSNPDKQGYQQLEAKIAIGSGQQTGRGAADASQTTLHFVPESNTDFIFAAVGEQYGFVGAALVLALYALLIWRALRVLTLSKNLYGALIAAGIVAMIMFQVFVNVGMNLGIMPITGVTLPLISYGGSSVITTFLALGLLQSIYVQARTTAAAKGRVLSF